MSKKSKPFHLNGYLIKDAEDIMKIDKLNARQKRNIIRLLTQHGILSSESPKDETEVEFTFKERISGKSPVEILNERRKRLLAEHEKLRQNSIKE